MVVSENFEHKAKNELCLMIQVDLDEVWFKNTSARTLHTSTVYPIEINTCTVQ